MVNGAWNSALGDLLLAKIRTSSRISLGQLDRFIKVKSHVILVVIQPHELPNITIQRHLLRMCNLDLLSSCSTSL